MIATSGSGSTLDADSAINLAGAARVSAGADGSLTIAVDLAGAGSLTKVDNGTVTLTGTNTYAGTTTISGGTLVATNVGALGTAGIANSGDFVLDLASADSGTLTNAIDGTGGLTKRGEGTLSLGGANSYTGVTTIDRGTLALGSSVAANGLAASSGIVFTNTAAQTATLDLNGWSATIQSLSGGNSDSGIALGTQTLDVQAGSYAGVISGGAGSTFRKTGSGTLVLSGALPLDAGFAGNVVVGQGTLALTGGPLATAGNFEMAAGATLGLVVADTANVTAASVAFGENSILNITGYRAATLGAHVLVAADAPIATVANVSLRFEGAAIAPSLDQYLTLALTQSADLKQLLVDAGLVWQSDTNAHGTFSIASADTVFSVTEALADETFTSALGGWDGRTLTKTGAGTLVLSKANTYTGATQVNAGTLNLGTANAIASSTAVTVAAGATLQTGDANQSVATLSGAGSLVLGNAVLTAANATADSTFSGVISGTGSLVKTGNATLTLGGANTYTGGTTVSEGKLVATQAGALGSGNAAVGAGTTLEFNLNTAGSGAYAGAISGGGNLVKSGDGTLTLTTTGATGAGAIGSLAANAGTLALGDGTHALAFTAGTAQVASGATLTVEKDSTLAVGGALDLADNSKLNLVVGGTFPVLTADSVTIGATATTLDIGGVTGSTATPFTLLTTTSGITGDFASITVGGGSGGVTDYLTVSAFKEGNSYIVKTGLIWNSTNASGSFTLTDMAESFDLGTVLADRAANPTTGWDGKSLTKAGAGTLTLSAVNTYTGTTDVTAGTLRFGTANAIAQSSAVTVAADGALDLNNQNQSLNNLSGAGDIALGGATLTANNAANGTLSGVISGTGGRLVKQGGGTLTLSGANTYSGGTTISGGRLAVANVAALGTGAVVNNAALDFTADATGTYAGTISGTGALTKAGDGTLEFTGNSSAFSGSTAVNAGTLAVNGRLGGTLTVASGARLQGAGTVGTTMIASGGTLAPGNSIGTLAVAGNLTFASGSIYEVEIDPSGAADRINVSGTASIQSGASVNVLKAGEYEYGTSYTILTADGGVTGGFSEITQALPLIDLILRQDANNVYLVVSRNTAAFDEYAQTPNQLATARVIESLGHTNVLYRTVTGLPDAATVQNAFGQLSGELHASLQGAFFDDARIVREASLDRGRPFGGQAASVANDSGAVSWIQIVGGEAEVKGSDLSDATRSTFGVLAGIDGAVGENTRLGLVVGHTEGPFEIDDLHAKAELSSAHLGTYANTRFGRLSLRGGGTYSRYFTDTERNVSVPGFVERLKVRREATVLQGFGEAGYFIPFKRGGVEPFANASYALLRTDEFEELGGDAALRGPKEVRDNPTTTLGARGIYDLSIWRWKAHLTGSLGWQHAYDSVITRQRLSFENSERFRIFGLPLSRDMIAVEGGLGLELTKRTRLDLGYSGRLSSDNNDHTARAVVTHAF
ncbi:MAG TPA: autotransporter-associated beta strand repeat-containing protein [Opitutaceae bacterium]